MRWILGSGVLIFVLVLAACTQGQPGAPADAQQTTVAPSTGATEEPTSGASDETDSSVKAPLLPEESPPPGATREFITDFSKHIVPYSEILSGGPPKDGIPAIDEPKFVSVAEADQWLKSREPVILFQIGDDVRAYPIQILIWHEIVNDVVGGVPVVVTFCPLCNTAIAFERTVDGQVLDFGTTGRLRYSNLIMYDRQTETWWQQASGEAIAGELVGRQLKFLPASIIAWAEFKEAYPDGKVLSRDTGFRRTYGRNPYAGYDDIDNSPFLYFGPETPDQLPPMARVITVDLNGEAVAYPYRLLQEVRVVNDTVGGTPVVVLWAPGTASPLDSAAIPGGRDIGTANVFSRDLDGQVLTFRFDGERVVDEQTGSVWNVLGQATEGPLAGSQLAPVVNINHFWFSWAAFRPETRVYQLEGTQGGN